MRNVRNCVIVLLVGIVAGAVAGASERALYKVFRFNTVSVGISCASGQLPEVSPRGGRVEDGLVIVSCR